MWVTNAKFSCCAIKRSYQRHNEKLEFHFELTLKCLLLGQIQRKLREIKCYIVPGVKPGNLNIQNQENLCY